MATTAKNVEFGTVTTSVTFNTTTHSLDCSKHFMNEKDEIVTIDTISYDLRVVPLAMALEMASAYVRLVTLTEYE